MIRVRNRLGKFQIEVAIFRGRNGAIGRALDLQFIGRGFESYLGTIVQRP